LAVGWKTYCFLLLLLLMELRKDEGRNGDLGKECGLMERESTTGWEGVLQRVRGELRREFENTDGNHRQIRWL